MHDLAAVDSVLQHQVERATRKASFSSASSVLVEASLADDFALVEFLLQQRDRAQFGVAAKNQPNPFGLAFIDDQLPVDRIVAERHVTAHPHAPPFRRGNLVANALAGDLPLELGKGQEYV